MEPTPTYFKPGKKVKPGKLFRNYWCSVYDQCLYRAAMDDLFLDCTRCFFKNDVVEAFSVFVKRKNSIPP